MARVVIVTKTVGALSDAARCNVTAKWVRDAAGGLRLLRVIDMQSPTFSYDLAYVFARNVTKARRENLKVTGASD